jgi:hypothetical protein
MAASFVSHIDQASSLKKVVVEECGEKRRRICGICGGGELYKQ